MAKVLVVDDDSGTRAAIRRTLLPLGHEVWDVPGGTEALSLLEVIPFDMAKNCGAAATLDKPFTPRQLRETVERVLPLQTRCHSGVMSR